MQRPSQRLILKYGVFQQFKQLNITTILNLQEPGEHADCGDGLVGHDGFSYLP
jgi:protein tyrosine phosphatase domain-containing protein 1